MDDCVRGGTHRHMQCAKLLLCWGGQLFSLRGTPEGKVMLGGEAVMYCKEKLSRHVKVCECKGTLPFISTLLSAL